SGEAIRLARELRRRLPDEGEVAGLLALMLLTDARRPARVREAGRLVPLEEQDRALWNRREIAEGIALISDSLARAPRGAYALAIRLTTSLPERRYLEERLARIASNPEVSRSTSSTVL